MPKNKGAGGKNRRKGKGVSKPKELVLRAEGEAYAQAIKCLGNGYIDVVCFIKRERITKRAHIRGSMRKKVYVGVGDIVLVTIREYERDKCDIILKYSTEESRILRNNKELPPDVEIGKTDMVGEEENDVVFEEGSGENPDAIFVPAQNRNYDILPPSDSGSSSDTDSEPDESLTQKLKRL